MAFYPKAWNKACDIYVARQFSSAITKSIKGAVYDVSGRDISTIKDTPGFSFAKGYAITISSKGTT